MQCVTHIYIVPNFAVNALPGMLPSSTGVILFVLGPTVLCCSSLASVVVSIVVIFY